MAGKAAEGATGDWYKRAAEIQGVLLDISGVLADSADGKFIPIDGSVEAVNRCVTCSHHGKGDGVSELYTAGHPPRVRFAGLFIQWMLGKMAIF